MSVLDHDAAERSTLWGRATPREEAEAFETRQLDPDDPLVPDFETFRAARERFLANVASTPRTPIQASDGPTR